MTDDPCERLNAYLDDELSPDERLAFEAHMASCDPCVAELPRLLALMSVLDDAAEVAAGAKSGAPRLALVPGASQSIPVAAGEPTGQPSDAPSAIRPPSRRRPRWIAAGLISAIAAAATIILVVIVPSGPPAPPAVASLQDQLGPTRGIEPRLSYPGADRYRPLDVARGARSNEAITIERMGQLEHAKDWHGVAVAALLAGERERATRFFAQAATTPQVDSDRAALELTDGSQDALERALDDVDRALKAEPNNPTALWNRALVLVGLNLPLAASREFDHVIALGEPGWADEARRRAAALRAEVIQRRIRWKQANDAGNKLIEDGTPVPAELMSVTGYMTIMLYDAVRAAPSKARVEALLPLAQTLDAAYRSDRLTSYVRRIATSDFRVRKPLTDTYRELIRRGPLPAAAVDNFLKQLERAHIDDIWMGAVVRTGQIGARLGDYRQRAASTQDPWFEVIAEHESAKADLRRGDLVAAERRMRDAIALARRERIVFRAILLEQSLGTMLRKALRLSQAAAVAQSEYRETTEGGEWLYEMNALSDLAATNHLRYSYGLTRAYLVELLERSNSSVANGATLVDEQYDCARRQYAYQSLANISLLLLEADRARSELSNSPTCDDRLAMSGEAAMKRLLTLQSASIWSELHHFGHREQDAVMARNALAMLQAEAPPNAGELAFLTYIEGNLSLDDDRIAGRRLLREAIAKAGRESDEFSVKARAYSLSLLALDSGRASEFNDVVDTLAETLGVKKPESCTIAIAAQDDRTVVAFSDSRGDVGGQFLANRNVGELDVSTLVPPAVAERLRPCAHISVMARAPVLGSGRLLPPEMAWSYLLNKGEQNTLSVDSGRRRLVIANPVPPADLNLPQLSPYPEVSGDVDVLRGAEATPSRVLQAMRAASVIEFHTHGFIANDISEASYLVLSPESGQQYTLTASDIAGIKLSAPLVILGACHAATSSRSLEGGMGLAEAFLRSGARAVVASPDAVQDLGAHAFFDAVREHVMHGAPPSVAVREERIRLLSTSRDNTWVSGVVVFE